MTQIKEFNNLDYLQAVRNDHLNPLIRRVETEIVPLLNNMEHEVSESVKDVTLDPDTKVIRFDKGSGGFKDIDLKSIIPESEGIGVQNIVGQGPVKGITLVQFPDATITQTNKTATVGFDWKEIFDHNQKWPEAVIKGAVSELKSVIFAGDPDAVTTTGTNVTVRIPKVDPLMVTLPDSTPAVTTPTEVKSLRVTGNAGGTVIDAQGRLTIDLPAGGSGTYTNQNFQGFYETLGDLVATVTNPIDGKTFAFAKDSKLGGAFYTPYFYVNNGWHELKQDPALTYSSPSDPTTHGVFSIKPSDKITVDSKGQLNLDGLSTPQLPQYFEGFFDSLDALKAEVPRPTMYQSFAFVKGPGGGWLTYRADVQGATPLWKVVAPLGSFSFVDEGSGTYSQVFGIKKSPAWNVDSRGLLELVGGGGPGGDLTAEITDYNGDMTSSKFNTIQFRKSKSNVTAYKDKLFIEHPQQVISYDADFEDEHNTQDFEGNIFYDETSRTWMGWGIPAAGGAVDVKWTRVLHPKMSDEVKDLTRRLPAKAPSVQPGIIGDNARWDYNGVTFVEKDSTAIPDELKGKCGGYITTSVQDKDAAGITIPQYRIQTLTADRPEGGTFVRRFDSTGSAGATVSWTPWVRTSFSKEDMEAHMTDPGAHKTCIKFYKATSFGAEYRLFANQMEGDSLGGVRASNCSLMADNYGALEMDQDYMQPAYDGKFRVRGVLHMAGYKDANIGKIPIGAWRVLVRAKHKGEGSWRTIGFFNYTHTNEKEKYPLLVFETDVTDMEKDDQVIINITFDNNVPLIRDHPGMYFVPLRSYFLLEDEKTRAGSRIARTFSKYIGNADYSGDVGLRVHHSKPDDPATNIRVYGEKLPHTLTEMTKLP